MHEADLSDSDNSSEVVVANVPLCLLAFLLHQAAASRPATSPCVLQSAAAPLGSLYDRFPFRAHPGASECIPDSVFLAETKLNVVPVPGLPTGVPQL